MSSSIVVACCQWQCKARLDNATMRSPFGLCWLHPGAVIRPVKCLIKRRHLRPSHAPYRAAKLRQISLSFFLSLSCYRLVAVFLWPANCFYFNWISNVVAMVTPARRLEVTSPPPCFLHFPCRAGALRLYFSWFCFLHSFYLLYGVFAPITVNPFLLSAFKMSTKPRAHEGSAKNTHTHIYILFACPFGMFSKRKNRKGRPEHTRPK